MPRMTVAVWTLLACAYLASAQSPERPVPKDGSDSKSETAKPNETAKPSKAELAKLALARADERHKAAIKQATDAMDKLEDFITKFDKGYDPKKIAGSIQTTTDKAMEGDDKDVDEAFLNHLSNLRHAEAGASLDQLEAQVVKASRDVKQQSLRKEREMRKAVEQMRNDKRTEARGLSREAQKAARASLKAARGLERAQRHAAVKERVFEGEMGHNEHVSEEMEDRAEDLGDRAENKIEHVFGQVEDLVDGNSDRVGSAADHRAESDRRAIKDARTHAEAASAAAHAAQAKEAAKDDGKSAGKGPANSDTGAAAKKNSAEDAKKPSQDADGSAVAAAPGEGAIGLAASRGQDLSAMEIVGLCGLSLSAGLALRLAAARARGGIREAPLLG